MKKIQTKLAMAIALLLAVTLNANAQPGGQTNQTQKEVMSKLEERRAARAADERAAQEKAGQLGLPVADAKQGDVDFIFFDGKRFGTYHPKTNSFDIFKHVTSSNQWVSYTFDFNKSGEVTYKGTKVGSINADGSMESGQTKGITIDKNNSVYWNGKNIGSISALCEIYYFSSVMVYYNKPIDPKIAAFMFFCQHLTDSSIKEQIESNKVAGKLPRAGTLNAKYHDAALASIKRRISDVQDVVITSNDWRIVRDNLGNIISRACDGWYIIKYGNGRRAISYCWSQKHLGGGKYDTLQASTRNGFDPIDLE